MIPASSQWSSGITSATQGTLGLILTIQGYSRVLTSWDTHTSGQYPWIRLEGSGPLSQSANDLAGGSSISNCPVQVIDYANQLTADMATFSFQGKQATLQIGLTSWPQSQFITMATMLVNKVDSDKKNTVYTFDLRDNSLLLQNYVWTVGDNGFATSNNSPVTAEAAPLTLATDVLTQAGLPSGSINTAAVNALASNALYGLTFLFSVTYPPRAKDWIEQELMVPLGCWWMWNYAGQWTPKTLIPYGPPSPVMTLDRTVIGLDSLPVPKQSDNYISSMAYFMDMDSNGQNAGNIFESIYAPAFNVYGMSQIHQIRSRGVKSALGGFRIAQMVMYAVCSRYGFKPLTCSANCSLPAALVEIGDQVLLTHPQVPNRKTGSMGITADLWEVTGKSFKFQTGCTNFSLLNVDWQQNPAYQIAPAGTPAFASASPTQQGQYMFIAGTGNTYSTGAAGHQVY